MLRNRLKYALTYREVVAIVMQRLIAIDGKLRTDKCYPADFMGRFFLWTYQKMLRWSAW
jgi:small subunit ribosomal protein S4e